MQGDIIWAQGTHEYKPMGAAVIAATNIFRPRDFSPHRKAPWRNTEGFAGLFASLEDINRYLLERRSQPSHRKFPKKSTLVFPTI